MLARPRNLPIRTGLGPRDSRKGSPDVSASPPDHSPIRSRRRGHPTAEESDSHGSWAISYGDMITLLLTFFILYFSVDDQKGAPPKLDASLLSALTRMDVKAEEKNTASGLDGALKDKPLRVGSLEDKGIVDFQAPEVGGKIHKLGSQLILEFPEVSFFEFGKIEVSKEGERTLKRFTQLYLPFAGQNRLGIRAFTDDRPVKKEPGKRFEDNLELSALRSVSTMRVLEKAGIPFGLMRLGGWGELHQTRKNIERAAAAVAPQPQPSEKGTPLGKGDPLSRKVVLVIEPEVQR